MIDGLNSSTLDMMQKFVSNIKFDNKDDKCMVEIKLYHLKFIQIKLGSGIAYNDLQGNNQVSIETSTFIKNKELIFIPPIIRTSVIMLINVIVVLCLIIFLGYSKQITIN